MQKSLIRFVDDDDLCSIRMATGNSCVLGGPRLLTEPHLVAWAAPGVVGFFKSNSVPQELRGYTHRRTEKDYKE